MRQVTVDNESLERSDEETPKGNYFSKKDVRTFLIITVVGAALLTPVYFQMLGNTRSYVCKSKNLRQISQAINLYATSNDERFPPIFQESAPNVPYMEQGAAVTWTVLVEPNMNKDATFLCPSADKKDGALVRSDLSSGSRLTTYGMYTPLGGEPTSLVPNPDNAVLITETSNFGASKTFDPLKFKDPVTGSEVTQDAFAIGFDNNNELPNPQSTFVTRLAFPNTQDGVFKVNGQGRHDKVIHAISVTGLLIELHPPDAKLQIINGTPTGYWAIPTSLLGRVTKRR